MSDKPTGITLAELWPINADDTGTPPDEEEDSHE